MSKLNITLFQPVPIGSIVTQRFGENPQYYPLTKGHNGYDWGIPEGTPIRAAADGVVVSAGLDAQTAANPKTGYGHHVRIQHAFEGLFGLTIYGHFKAGGCLVKTGDIVKMGDEIGLSGNTGNSTGPHLHFELRTSSVPGFSYGQAIDPEPYLTTDLLSSIPAPAYPAVLVATVRPGIVALRLRKAPSTYGEIHCILKPGAKLEIAGLAGKDAWLQTTDGKYVCYNPDWLELEEVK